MGEPDIAATEPPALTQSQSHSSQIGLETITEHTQSGSSNDIVLPQGTGGSITLVDSKQSSTGAGDEKRNSQRTVSSSSGSIKRLNIGGKEQNQEEEAVNDTSIVDTEANHIAKNNMLDLIGDIDTMLENVVTKVKGNNEEFNGKGI